MTTIIPITLYFDNSDVAMATAWVLDRREKSHRGKQIRKKKVSPILSGGNVRSDGRKKKGVEFSTSPNGVVYETKGWATTRSNDGAGREEIKRKTSIERWIERNIYTHSTPNPPTPEVDDAPSTKSHSLPSNRRFFIPPLDHIEIKMALPRHTILFSPASSYVPTRK